MIRYSKIMCLRLRINLDGTLGSIILLIQEIGLELMIFNGSTMLVFLEALCQLTIELFLNLRFRIIHVPGFCYFSIVCSSLGHSRSRRLI